jgi:uncharacterized membrane protein YfhO
MSYVLLFITSLIFIGLRAFQQLNVQHDRYLWVPPTTACMAVVEITQLLTVVKQGTLLAAIPVAIGGVLGCWLSMYYHAKLRSKR